MLQVNKRYFEITRQGSFLLFIRLGLNVALTHQNMSYRDSETKGNVEE